MRAGAFLAAGLLFLWLPAASVAACPSTPEQRAESFAALDEDGDGVLSLREYFSQSHFGGITAEKEREIFSGIDTDGDGVLSPDEFFVQAMQKRCGPPGQ